MAKSANWARRLASNWAWFRADTSPTASSCRENTLITRLPAYSSSTLALRAPMAAIFSA